MNIIYQTSSEILPPCVATVGIFDGVHAGHRYLIEELKALAKSQNLESVVITFAKHPRSVISPDFKPDLITTLDEKVAQIATTGVDTCIVLDFTFEMAQLSAYEFLNTILQNQYNVHTLLVGHDHRFGHDRLEGFAEYKKYGQTLGMQLIQAKRYKTEEDLHISSSEIRLALLKGDIQLANRMLTYPYSIKGKVTGGFKVGRKIGFPTANIYPNNANKIIPAFGVYAVRVCWNNEYFKGMLNIGTRPTLTDDTSISIEVHILDFDEDIYNQVIVIDFIAKIRDEQKFNGIDALIGQLQKDKLFVSEMVIPVIRAV
ncbi:MAG: riboflavin biosynthesis protein RibF [Paludibacter sp.]